jgi:hypothetical protein
LEVDLQARLEKMEIGTSWPVLMRDIRQLQAVRMTLADFEEFSCQGSRQASFPLDAA